MVLLTRLNGLKFYLNAELIKILESSPDTTVTLVNGEKLVIAEPVTAVVDAVLAYRRDINRDVNRQSSELNQSLALPDKDI